MLNKILVQWFSFDVTTRSPLFIISKILIRYYLVFFSQSYKQVSNNIDRRKLWLISTYQSMNIKTGTFQIPTNLNFKEMSKMSNVPFVWNGGWGWVGGNFKLILFSGLINFLIKYYSDLKFHITSVIFTAFSKWYLTWNESKFW